MLQLVRSRRCTTTTCPSMVSLLLIWCTLHVRISSPMSEAYAKVYGLLHMTWQVAATTLGMTVHVRGPGMVMGNMTDNNMYIRMISKHYVVVEGYNLLNKPLREHGTLFQGQQELVAKGVEGPGKMASQGQSPKLLRTFSMNSRSQYIRKRLCRMSRIRSRMRMRIALCDYGYKYRAI